MGVVQYLEISIAPRPASPLLHRSNKTPPLTHKYFTSREDVQDHEGVGCQNIPHYTVVEGYQDSKKVQVEHPCMCL